MWKVWWCFLNILSKNFKRDYFGCDLNFKKKRGSEIDEIGNWGGVKDIIGSGFFYFFKENFIRFFYG